MRSVAVGTAPVCLSEWSVKRGDWRDFVLTDRDCYASVLAGQMALVEGHCAYCERVLTMNGAQDGDRRPHIEHFVPRSFRPGLAFCWENLLASCSNKGHCGHAKAANTTPILNPRVQNPEGVLVLRPMTGMIEVRTAGICESCRQLGEQAVQLLNLNDPGLTVHRRNAYRQWEGLMDGSADDFIQEGDFGVLILAARRPPSDSPASRCLGCDVPM